MSCSPLRFVVIGPGAEKPTMRDKREAVQVKCPKCKRTQIVYIPEEDIPKCPDCKIQMNIEELLDEGKSY